MPGHQSAGQPPPRKASVAPPFAKPGIARHKQLQKQQQEQQMQGAVFSNAAASFANGMSAYPVAPLGGGVAPLTFHQGNPYQFNPQPHGAHSSSMSYNAAFDATFSGSGNAYGGQLAGGVAPGGAKAPRKKPRKLSVSHSEENLQNAMFPAAGGELLQSQSEQPLKKSKAKAQTPKVTLSASTAARRASNEAPQQTQEAVAGEEEGRRRYNFDIADICHRGGDTSLGVNLLGSGGSASFFQQAVADPAASSSGRKKGGAKAAAKAKPQEEASGDSPYILLEAREGDLLLAASNSDSSLLFPGGILEDGFSMFG